MSRGSEDSEISPATPGKTELFGLGVTLCLQVFSFRWPHRWRIAGWWQVDSWWVYICFPIFFDDDDPNKLISLRCRLDHKPPASLLFPGWFLSRLFLYIVVPQCCFLLRSPPSTTKEVGSHIARVLFPTWKSRNINILCDSISIHIHHILWSMAISGT